MDEAEEDKILKQAEEIESRIFREAEKKWEEAPDTQKPRPWLRCGSISCNRTMICLHPKQTCQGFDY